MTGLATPPRSNNVVSAQRSTETDDPAAGPSVVVDGALAPDGEAGQVSVISGLHPGDSYLRIKRRRDFRRVGSGYLVPRGNPDARKRGLRAALGKPWRLLVGRRLATAEEPHERVSVFTGLSVFASDNISSSAYATEEIMRVLALAGAGALALTLPITLTIVLVLAIVVMSYQQTIAAYPNGGGSYIVSSDNLGRLPGLVSAAALLTDYVLTVSVSIAAGVAALTSICARLVRVSRRGWHRFCGSALHREPARHSRERCALHRTSLRLSGSDVRATGLGAVAVRHR